MTSAVTGRPRMAEIDHRVIGAALDLLVEGATLDTLSFVAVAAKAGVSRNSLYRRWPTKEELLLDALVATNEEWVVPEGTDTRSRLLQLVASLYRRGREGRASRLVRCLLSEGDRFPALRQRYADLVITPRRAAIRQVLGEGMESGELRDDLDIETAILVLAGPPLFYGMSGTATGVLGENSPESSATLLVDLVLIGAKRPAS